MANEPGAVVDGVWERGGDELIRRVDPDEARRFLGTRTVRVPAGSVGVVLVDGLVHRVLAPGERTSVSMFERIATFFTGRERTAFYLVDQRPFPVPFVVRTRPSTTGEVVTTQVIATFMLPKGDRDALAAFIANVMGARASVSIGDLYNLLRPEVVRIGEAVIERQGDAISYPDAEGEIRRQLESAIARRYGLTVSATLAPLTSLVSLNLTLDSQLFTSDGQAVELDLVVRAQGRHDDFTPRNIEPAIATVAARRLRELDLASLAGPGLRALEDVLAPAVAEMLVGLGMTLVMLSVRDARSVTGQWLLAARAELERQDQRFIEAEAMVADRERRDDLAQRDARLELSAIERDAASRRARVEAELAEVERRKRLELELAELAERQQLEKLRAMVEIDREIAEREQVHVLARRAGLSGLTPEHAIAMQAAELAKAEGGGAAWANALAARADDERRHAAEQRAVYDRAMAAMAQVAASRAEAAPVVAAPIVQVTEKA